jgi:small subunit ribosomal protein S13
MQVTAIAAFLSSPSTSPIPTHGPLASLTFKLVPPLTPLQNLACIYAYLVQLDAPPLSLLRAKMKGMDPLCWLWIEADLKCKMQENLVHQQMIRSYVGKRHMMGLPVHGQNTQMNARMVRKLNRVEQHR